MEIKPEELLHKLKQGREKFPLPNVILLRGEELYYRSRLAQAVPDHVFGTVPEADREITIFEKDTNLQELAAAINSYPFFSGQSLIILRDEKLLGAKLESGERRQQFEQLHNILCDVPEYCTVLLVASKLDGKTKLYREIKKNGLLCQCDSIRTYNIGPWLDAQAGELGGSLEREAVDTIMEYLMTVDEAPLSLLRQELEKLAVYAGERRRWTREDVEAVFAALPQAGTFALNNALAERRLAQALELLAAERKKGTFILLLCGMVQAQLRRMLRFKEYAQQRYGQKEIMLQMGMKTPFMYNKLSRQCARFTSSALQKALLALAELNAGVRGGGRQYERLEEILVELLS